MPNGPRLVMDHACYHITARGNQKRRIFYEDIDFEEYLSRIRIYKKKYGFKLYGYCLMPNHIHLSGELGNKKHLSKFMQSLTRSYTAYFNKKYKKVGYLWQGRFKNRIIVKDRYLIDCMNYIELNPVRAGIVNAPHEYRWSSYRERCLGIIEGKPMLDVLEI